MLFHSEPGLLRKWWGLCLSSSSLLLSSLELSDAKVYEPQIRALLGTASQFWVASPARHFGLQVSIVGFQVSGFRYGITGE